MAGQLRKIYKTFFDVPTWLGAKEIASTTKKLASQIETVFVVPETERTETFEEALTRLNLTEQDLEQRVQEFSRLLSFHLALGACFYLYWIYLIWERHWLSVGVMAAVLCLSFSQIFRYHFWLYQIQQQKLGATFGEWIKFCIGKKA